MNNKSLLIGNGLNRTIDNKYSSLRVLQTICDSEKIHFDNIEEMNISFQLLFETIYYEYAKKRFDEKRIFKDIKKLLKPLDKTNNELLQMLKGSNQKYESILTTNYDFAIEYNLYDDETIKTRTNSRNQGYNYKNIVYHIHGDFCDDHSICLGRIKYQKYLKSCTSNIKNNVLSYKTLDDICNALPFHLQKFLVNDVDIIGFNLDSTELIIWYILTLRAYIKNCSKNIIINNVIHYYHAIEVKNNYDREKIKVSQERIKKYYNSLCIVYDYKIIESGNSGFKQYYRDIINEIIMQ